MKVTVSNSITLMTVNYFQNTSGDFSTSRESKTKTMIVTKFQKTVINLYVDSAQFSMGNANLLSKIFIAQQIKSLNR